MTRVMIDIAALPGSPLENIGRLTRLRRDDGLPEASRVRMTPAQLADIKREHAENNDRHLTVTHTDQPAFNLGVVLT